MIKKCQLNNYINHKQNYKTLPGFVYKLIND